MGLPVSADIELMILDNLQSEPLRHFLYTCKGYFYGYVKYFAIRKTDNGLIYAAKNKGGHLLKAMLSIDEVDVHIKDETGLSALDIALDRYRYDEGMLCFLATNPKISTQKPLMSLIYIQSEHACSILRSGNINFDAEDRYKSPLLHVAIREGGFDLARRFSSYARASDFERVDGRGLTPLFWAIRYRYEEVVSIYFSKRRKHSSMPHFLDNRLLFYATRYGMESTALDILRLRGFRLNEKLKPYVLRLAVRNRLNLVEKKLHRLINDT
jgi:hypothetical protein